MSFHSGEVSFLLSKYSSDSYDVSKRSAFETVFGDGFTYADGAPLTLFAASTNFSEDMPMSKLEEYVSMLELEDFTCFYGHDYYCEKTEDAGNKTYLWRSESASKTFQYHYNDYSIY